MPSTESSLVIETRRWEELSCQDLEIWEGFRADSTKYRSPFFSPRFIDAVARVKQNVEVMLFKRGSRTVGFLPFERISRSRLAPAGGAFNDAHGIICSKSSHLDYASLVGTGALRSFPFHALEGEATGFESFTFNRINSYLADLDRHPQGYVSFLEETRATIFKQRRKTKKMVKDLGPLRLEFDCRDPKIFEKMIELKRAQYQRTFIFDILSVEWARVMLRSLWDNHEASCRGLVSVLYSGDTLVAVHLGLLEGDWLHYWFPTFDPQYHQYSPGTALFLEIARNAKQLGISKVDMGYGEQPYKHKLTDTITSMPQGFFDSSPFRWHGYRSKQMAVKALKRVPFKESAKKIVRSIWPNLGQSKYQ